MTRSHRDDMTLFRSIEAACGPPSRRRSRISPNDALVNVAWPLIMILAIAVIAVAGQAEAIDSIGTVVEGWKEDGKDEAIIEIFRQKLIRKIDAVCADKSRELKLDLFPEFSRVSIRSGWPNDQLFGELCESAGNNLIDVESLTTDLYAAALAFNEDGLEKMYDPVVFPDTAPVLEAPSVIGTTRQSAEHREFALSRIRERCTDWQSSVVGLQRLAVDHLLDSRAVKSVRAAEASQTAEKIREGFATRGYPLLPQSL